MPLPSPAQKAAQIRIDRAMGLPGAKGKRGFLLWVAAAYPKKVSDVVMRAAAKHVPPGGFAGFGYGPRTRWASPTMFSGLGDLMSIGVDPVDLTPSTSQAVADATDSGPASTSWVTDIGNAFTSILPALTQAGIAKQQLAQNQALFNTNLQLAAQGKPLITSDISRLTSVPTLHVGLAGGTEKALFIGIAAIAGTWLVSSLISKRGRKH